MIILIPPSEGKREGGNGPPAKPSKHTLEILKRYRKEKDHAKLLGVKGDALEAAHHANLIVLEAPTMPAIERYTGVVYDALDHDSLDEGAKRFCDEHLRIVSAMFGLVEPQQMIPNYKLKIEKLQAFKLWKPGISKQLEGEFVIDLLPKAHARAVAYDDGIRVEFYGTDGKSLGHFGKHIKGRFIRWLCENRVSDPDGFSGFSEEGFVWTGERFERN